MIFRETQFFRQWWLVGAIGLMAIIGWWAFISQVVLDRPFGEDPVPDAVIWVVFLVQSILLPLVAWRLRLETTVTPEVVRVQFPPFRARELAVDAVVDAQAIGYRVLRDYAGYGYRPTPDGEVAFIVSGDRAVQLSSGAGERLVIGSQRPNELLAAIEQARRA